MTLRQLHVRRGLLNGQFRFHRKINHEKFLSVGELCTLRPSIQLIFNSIAAMERYVLVDALRKRRKLGRLISRRDNVQLFISFRQ